MGRLGRFPACRMVLPVSQAIGRLRALASKVAWDLFFPWLGPAVSICPLVQKRYEMRGKLDDKVDIDKNDINSKFGWAGRFLIEAWGNCCQQWLDLHGA